MGTESYSVGMCELFFGTGSLGGGSTSLGQIRTFGDIVAAEITPAITYLDHFVSIEGDKRKDKSVAVVKALSIPFTFDEIDEENVRSLMGGVNIPGFGPDSNAGGGRDTVMTTTMPLEGRAILRFKTKIGKTFSYSIPRCALKAEGGLAFNVDSWIQGKFTLEILRCTDSTQTTTPYGILDYDLSGSSILSDCETLWSRVPEQMAIASKVIVRNTATYYQIGTKSCKVTVATFFKYRATKPFHASNCLAYVSVMSGTNATDISSKNFLELWFRASRDYYDNQLYIGFTRSVLAASLANATVLNYTGLLSQTAAVGWQKQILPMFNVNATGLSTVKAVGIYAGAGLAVNTGASIPTFWFDQIRMKK